MMSLHTTVDTRTHEWNTCSKMWTTIRTANGTPLLHNAGLSTKCGYRVEGSPVFSALSPPQPLFIHRADTKCEYVGGGWILVTVKQAVARTAVRTGHQLDPDEQPRR